MSFSSKLQKILGDYPDGGEVEVTEDGKLASLTSTSFEGMDEAERQAKVWGFLLERIPDDELYRLEFVFTRTPQEKEHAEAA